ncbi:hypothetical protein ACJW30_08G029900 [Castanea mollissima]
MEQEKGQQTKTTRAEEVSGNGIILKMCKTNSVIIKQSLGLNRHVPLQLRTVSFINSHKHAKSVSKIISSTRHCNISTSNNNPMQSCTLIKIFISLSPTPTT